MHSFEAEGREFESLRARHLLLRYPALIWSHFLFVPGSGLTVITHETAILFPCRRPSHLLFQGSDAPAPTTPFDSGAWVQDSNDASRAEEPKKCASQKSDADLTSARVGRNSAPALLRG